MKNISFSSGYELARKDDSDRDAFARAYFRLRRREFRRIALKNAFECIKVALGAFVLIVGFYLVAFLNPIV